MNYFKPSTKKLFVLIFAVLLVLIFFRFFSLLSFPQSAIILDKGELIQLKTGQTIRQKFTANQNGLNKVELLLRTPGIPAGAVVKMKIMDADCQTTIRQGKLAYSFLDSGNLHEFVFPRITDSENTAYCLDATLDAPGSKTVKFFTMSGSTFPDAAENISTGEKNGDQSLSLRSVYSNGHWWQNIEELNQRISQYKPFFLKHYFLYALAFGFIFLSLAVVTLLILL